MHGSRIKEQPIYLKYVNFSRLSEKMYDYVDGKKVGVGRAKPTRRKGPEYYPERVEGARYPCVGGSDKQPRLSHADLSNNTTPIHPFFLSPSAYSEF